MKTSHHKYMQSLYLTSLRNAISDRSEYLHREYVDKNAPAHLITDIAARIHNLIDELEKELSK